MYSHKKIIFCNSGQFAYSEVDLDHHCLIKATGNAGKSSILNALKLVWLPEVTFGLAEKKFKFATKGTDRGFYSGEDSYGFYFPSSQTSYIIYEAKNNHGTFCQILYPRARLGYGRLMVNCDYSQIEDLFWLKSIGELGLGEPNPSLSFAHIIKELKARNITTEEVTTVSRLTDVLYSDSLLDDDSAYAIFPLKEQSEQSVDTFRSLVHSICGFTAGSSNLGTLFARVIESKKKDGSDYLSMNLQNILAERHTLDIETNSLNQLEALRPKASEIFHKSDSLEDMSISLGVPYVSMCRSVDKALSEVNGKSISSVATLTALTTQLSIHTDLASKHKTDKAIAFGSLKILRPRIAVATEMRLAVERIYSEFPSDTTEDEMLEMLEEQKVSDNETLADFNDTEKLIKRKKELETSIIPLLAEKIKISKGLIENSHNRLLNSLSESDKSVLLSVNSKFGYVDIKNTPDHTQVTEKLIEFASLFTVGDNLVTLGNVSFPLQTDEQSLEQARNNLTADENSLSDARAELRDYAEFNDSGRKARIEKIKELEEQIELTVKDKSILKSYRSLYDSQQGEIVDAAALEIKLKDSDDAAVKEQQSATEVRQKIKIEKEGKTTLTNLAMKLSGYKSRLALATNSIIYDAMIERATNQKIDDNLMINDQAVDSIARGMGTYKKDLEQVRALLIELVADGTLDDSQKVSFEASSNYFALKPLIEALAEKFEQVEPRRLTLDGNKSSHKAMISMKMQELRRNSEAINVFETGINRMFDDININNLEGVKVSVNMDKRFSNLIAQTDATDLHGNEEISDAFYERLSDFINTFFRGQDDESLTIERLIKSVTFKTKLTGKDWADTAQSNSSTNLISITLLQRMMRDYMNPDIATVLPLVIDEVAHIDESEFPWLLENLVTNGFRLLSASTNNISIYSLEAIGRECNIGECQVEKVYQAGRNVVYLGYEGRVFDVE